MICYVVLVGRYLHTSFPTTVRVPDVDDYCPDPDPAFKGITVTYTDPDSDNRICSNGMYNHSTVPGVPVPTKF